MIIQLNTLLRSRRGYLLIESMISSSIMAATLAGSIHMMGRARANISEARHVDVATSLALQKAQALLGEPQTATSGSDTPAFGFTRTWSESQSGITTNVQDADTLHEIVVNVRYSGEGGISKNATYRVLKRKKRF